MRKKVVSELRNADDSSGTRRELATLDHIDRHVVAALQAQGRRPFSSIAEEIGISESVVRYRVQRLEDAGILQVVGIADPLRIGFDLMSMVGVKVVPGSISDVCDTLSALPETSYVAAVAGQYDVLVEVVCRDTSHFQNLLNERIHRVPGVTSTESFLILEIHKMAYGWGVGDHGVPLAELDGDDVLAHRAKTPSRTPAKTPSRTPARTDTTQTKRRKSR